MAPVTPDDPSHTKKDQAIGRMVFTVLGIALTITCVFLFRARITNPNGNVDWSVVIVVGVIGLILDYLVALIWLGAMLEAWGEECDADFVRVKPASLAAIGLSGQNEWIIECSWQDIVTGIRYTWTSPPFSGDRLYYNRHKIRVNYFAKYPKTFNLVDITFISKLNQNGILLVDDNVIAKAYAEGDQYRKDRDERIKNRTSKSRAIQAAVKIIAVVLIIVLTGWWSYSCDGQ